MPKHGKKYREAQAKVTQLSYSIADAIALLKETSTAKFDASCELHMNLGIDPRHADQIIRSTVVLPNGTGKKLNVIALVGDDKVDACKAAGAIEAGGDNLIDKIGKGWTDFDVAVATPDMMPKLGKVAKTLGQKGLMPSPKAGTVSPKPADVIKEIMSGKIEYRNDKQGNIHNVFGKVSFDASKLEENAKTLLKAVVQSKPSGVKGAYVKSVFFTTSMGPSVPVNLAEVTSL